MNQKNRKDYMDTYTLFFNVRNLKDYIGIYINSYTIFLNAKTLLISYLSWQELGKILGKEYYL